MKFSFPGVFGQSTKIKVLRTCSEVLVDSSPAVCSLRKGKVVRVGTIFASPVPRNCAPPLWEHDDKSLAEDDADEDPPESPYAWAFGVLLDAKATMAPKIVSVTLLYLMMAFQIMLCFIQAAPKEGTLTAYVTATVIRPCSGAVA